MLSKLLLADSDSRLTALVFRHYLYSKEECYERKRKHPIWETDLIYKDIAGHDREY